MARLACLLVAWALVACGDDAGPMSDADAGGTGGAGAGGTSGSGGVGATSGSGGAGGTSGSGGVGGTSGGVVPSEQEAYIKASNTGDSDWFGGAVALSADGSTLAIGARFEDGGANGIDGDQADNNAGVSGAVYVFTRSGGVWMQQAYVKASNTGASDSFGNSVALSADGSTLSVGSHGEDSNATGIDRNQADDSATDSGAAYVFTRSGGVWMQQAYVKASNTEAGDRFGGAVALSMDGDTLIVGAAHEDSNATGVGGDQADNNATDSGAVYVFARSGSVWSQQTYVKASNTGSGGRFGAAVVLSADEGTLVVGASHESSNATGIDGNQADSSASSSGAAYVFARSSGAWSQQAYLKASNTDAVDNFGSSVALSGEGNTLAVGAYWEDGNATGIDGNQTDNGADDAGAVYVFARSGSVWTQQAYVKGSNTESGDNFGVSLGLSADGNALVVGAWKEASNTAGIDGDQADNSANASGAVYVFARSGKVWSQRAYIKASNTESGDGFGHSLALSADASTLAVGAVNEGSNATGVNGDQTNNNTDRSGAAYVFR